MCYHSWIFFIEFQVHFFQTSLFQSIYYRRNNELAHKKHQTNWNGCSFNKIQSFGMLIPKCASYELIISINFKMSEKKSKSKSKQKIADKAQKPAKAKKTKQDKGDSVSKASKGSVQKADKSSKEKKSKADKSSKADKQSKAGNKLQNSRISKGNQDNLSQNQFSLYRPFTANPPPAKINQSLCPYHNEPNTHFCEVCEQVGCGSCLVYGPHNNQMHRLTKIEQAFKARYLYLNEIVCNDLLAKRDKLNQRLEDLNSIGDELRFAREVIEKQTKMEFNQTMEKLNISAGNKFAILNHEMACLQQDLQSINTLGNEFFQLTNVNPEKNTAPETNPHKGMVPFLLRAKVLQEQTEQLISKPIKTSVDVFPYDLPRDVTEKKLVIEKNRGWLDLLRVKDEVIWHLLEEKKIMSQSLWESFYEEAQNEVLEWQRLNEQLREQTESYNMRCRQCGVGLTEGTINQQCGDHWHYFE